MEEYTVHTDKSLKSYWFFFSGQLIIKIRPNSPYVGKSVWDAEVEIKFSGEVFDVIAIRRRKELIPYPDENEKLQIGDIIIVKSYNEESEIDKTD
ncbi:MAG: hypothetical protein GPJ54_22755 [Candidatus Heimdallarchaeota archaeon]|nr:hypothetical protein [Candidatus Heimdallarchaeota archaeon]